MSTDKSINYSNRGVAKSAGVIGLATLISRILGFIRDVVIARLFGTQIYAQAFVIAFKIPNLFRDLLGEGAANAAFVPVFSEYSAKRSRQEFWELANVMLNLLLITLMSVTILGIIFAPFIVRLIAPGFSAFPDKLEATIKLTRLIFPYILLISLAAYSMGILNSLRHFAVPAFAPCLLNISVIIFAIIFGESIKGLALGVLVGGALQLAIQIPVLYKKGFRLKIPLRLTHPAAKTIGGLMAPRVLSSGIYQLNNFVDTIFGSLAWIVGEGGVAVLYFSYRLIQFPLGIFSTSLSQAALPTFSTQAIENDREKLRNSLSWSLRATFFVMLPASAGLIALAQPIISALFGAGKFDEQSVMLTSNALVFYSIGLSAYGSTRILQSCYFALKDTVTPAKIAALALVMNIILNAILMFPLKIGGIALATSLSGINTSLLLFFILKKKLGGFGAREIASSFLRILAASLAMGAVCFYLNKSLSLFLVIPIGFLSYVLFCFIFRVSEIKQLCKWLRAVKS